MRATDQHGLTYDEQLTIDVANVVGATLNGTAGTDVILGTKEEDYIDGKAGADKMTGGLGNDTYVVDNAGDIVVEKANGGIDTIFASVTKTLGANLENLTLTGAQAIHGTGNSAANVIIGNDAANRLSGKAGNDTINGHDGNDIIDGGLGVDVLTGGSGADAFVFEAGQANGDTITDFDGRGNKAGDRLYLVGYGEGVVFSQVDATHWQISYGANLESHDVITFLNGASVHTSDVIWG